MALERGCGTCLPGPWATSHALGWGYSRPQPHLAHSPTVSMGKSKVSTGASVDVGSPSRLTILTQPVQGEDWWVRMGWLPYGEADPHSHGFPHSPLTPSTDPSPDLRGTHGQSRLGLCPCPPGSPAGLCPGAPLQADKGDVLAEPPAPLWPLEIDPGDGYSQLSPQVHFNPQQPD